jgi:hypothetical protein
MASGGHRVNVVLTAYLTGRPDPQRGTMWPADREALKPLLDSIPGSVVVFANELQGEAVEPVEAPTSVYFDRWRHYAAYLEAHEEIGFAFCVDATDVLMLRDPFPHMHPGTLYCGSEPLTIGESAWMWQHHEPLRDWMAANAGRVLRHGHGRGPFQPDRLRRVSRLRDWAASPHPLQGRRDMLGRLVQTQVGGKERWPIRQ